MSLGWTWDQAADQMDFPRLGTFNKYWKKNPPVHKMVASYFGISKNSTTDAPAPIPEDALAFLGLE